MPSNRVRILFIGDVIGRYGRYFLRRLLLPIKRKYRPDLIIANGENSAGGLGIIKKTADEIFIESEYSRMLRKMWGLYGAVNGRSQFDKGYDYSTDPKTFT